VVAILDADKEDFCARGIADPDHGRARGSGGRAICMRSGDGFDAAGDG